MLKNIPAIISPELLKVLCEMGHSDRICIGDGNFPGAAMAKAEGAIFLRADGHGIPELLDAILQVFPLDTYVETPVMLMEKMEREKDLTIPVWDEYKKIIAKHDDRSENAVGSFERFEFYEQAKNATVFCRPVRLLSMPISFYKRVLFKFIRFEVVYAYYDQ